MIPSHILTFLCLSGSIWGVGVIRAAVYAMPVMTSSCCVITGCCPQHFPTTPWTLNWPSSLPVACQSRESPLYASKPLGWSLTLQSSVNYSVTDNLAVILKTIKQAIKPLCIAGSGPERPGHLHPAGREASGPLMTLSHFFIYLYTYLFVGLHFFSLRRVGMLVGEVGSDPSTGASFWLSKWDFPGGPQCWHICSYALICFSSLCETWPWSPF